MAVILAAGESSRMGSTKPLLAWDGKTLLRHCAERALASICDEVHVIVGPDATALERELEGLSLTTTRVEYAKDGMGATLAGTIQTLPDRTRGVVVLLCDQPFVTTDLIDNLVQRGKESEMVACSREMLSSFRRMAEVWERPITVEPCASLYIRPTSRPASTMRYARSRCVRSRNSRCILSIGAMRVLSRSSTRLLVMIFRLHELNEVPQPQAALPRGTLICST